MDCNCPAPPSLTEIPTQDCPINMGQIQRYGFQRGGNGFDTAGTPATDIKLLADWQAAMAATDDTKIVVTPLIGADPIIAAGDPITSGGGDNSTLNGVEQNDGTNPAAASATFNSISPEVEKAIKALMCEPNLTVYLFLQGNRIAVVETTPDAAYEGFEAQSFFFGDRDNQGFGTKDTNLMSFSLPSGWSENLHIIDADELDFNALTDL